MKTVFFIKYPILMAVSLSKKLCFNQWWLVKFGTRGLFKALLMVNLWSLTAKANLKFNEDYLYSISNLKKDHKFIVRNFADTKKEWQNFERRRI